MADTFDVTVEAFNLAEHYQTPVIILSDQEIGQRKETVDPIDTSRFKVEERRRPTESELRDYARFRMTDSGISPVSHPGMKGGNYQGAGIEHNEQGNPTASGKLHAAMNEKRFRKLTPSSHAATCSTSRANPNAKLGIVAWGSAAGVCREVYTRARPRGST